MVEEGQRLRIRTDLKLNKEYENRQWTKHHAEWAGRIVTVTGISTNGRHFNIKEDGSIAFSETMTMPIQLRLW